MSKPLVVSIPHHLGREEAERRIKSGLATVRAHYAAFLSIHEETWSGDRLIFNISALGQSAAGLIDFADDHVRLEVTLPWLLAVLAEKFTPAIRKEGTLLLEIARSTHRQSTKAAMATRPHQLATSMIDIMKNRGSQAKPPGINKLPTIRTSSPNVAG